MIELAVHDPETFARRLNLRYVHDTEPGATRHRRGRGFSFHDASGVAIRTPSLRSRFESLAIPPAWKGVWICLDPRGHLQATGRDGRDRKQYRYHNVWSQSANRAKFDALIRFGESLPTLRRRVRRDMKRRGLDRRRVLATVVRILDRGYLRLGNDAYTAENQTFGATTLRPRHVVVDEDSIEVSFVGKHHQDRSVELNDPLLASVIDELSQTRKKRLFRFRQSGTWQEVRSQMVNDYLTEICGDGITAKWFRTWHGSRLMLEQMLRHLARSEQPLKRHINEGIREVASQLGNKPATCRRYYVHPAIAESYLNGDLEVEHADPRRDFRRSEEQLFGLVEESQLSSN